MKILEMKLPLDYEKWNLGDGYHATMTCYLPYNSGFLQSEKRPAVIVCPGGGYSGLADREAEPVAMQYAAQGMAAFVLYYSTGEHASHPRDVLEGLTAIKTIRDHAEEWDIDTNKIAISGFSAGGHFTAAVGAFWDSEIAKRVFGDCELCKPNAVILSYPVITSGEWAHRGSFKNLIGEEAPQEEWDQVSIEKLVTEHYPPAFLWHTATDSGVPVQNSLLMAMALAEKKVPFELHVYPKGPHGLSLSDERTAGRVDGVPRPDQLEMKPRQWMADSISFLKDIAFAE